MWGSWVRYSRTSNQWRTSLRKYKTQNKNQGIDTVKTTISDDNAIKLNNNKKIHTNKNILKCLLDIKGNVLNNSRVG